MTSTEAIGVLGFHHEHFKALVEIGFLAAVAYGDDGQPRFSKNQVEDLRRDPSKYEQLRAVISDNFGRFGARRGSRDRVKERPTPHYPYDTPGQAAWARRRQELAPRLWRCREARREVDAVVQVHERAAGQQFQDNRYFDPDARVRAVAKITREQLYKLIWSKPMDPAATEVGMTETPLRQLCYECCIPTPPRGFFNFNDRVDRPPRTPLPVFPKRQLK
ncbi:hypothetical protein [Tardiphaga sp. 709]|uniref:hypothetical protein n=1 Tax=Tardiphaga sp. 709 TaxID=3076039 RepID=UPI0028E93635|nr:hypothetical protein [Tardiphaga sp. 709]WNV09605.1 hypothetical protein RSO67_29855 [Tardiphaga sp. 709]